MNTDRIHTTTQEPLDDEERELMDPETWDWDTTIEGRTVGTPGAVLRVRFTREEIVALERIARAADTNPIDFIHQIMLDRIATDDEDTLESRAQQPASARHAATG